MISRRNFLRAAASLAALSMAPRSALAGPKGPTGSVKRLVVVHLTGGVRWTASFDGLADPSHNPWGLAPWAALGAMGPAPEWGFSRALVQKPIATSTTDWTGQVLPYLGSDDHYSLARPKVAGWGGETFPSFADIAGETAIVRVTNDPGQPPNTDHRAATTQLMTGFASGGEAGLLTALYDAAKRQYGTALDDYYLLPPILTGETGGFGVGGGDYAASRALRLIPGNLPVMDAAATVAHWSRGAELALDPMTASGLHPFVAQRVLDHMSDQAALQQFGPRLLDKALHLGDAPDAAFGTLTNQTPLTNAMLLEAFGATSDVAPAGDILFDAHAALGQPSWSDGYGVLGAFGVRLLQLGAPAVVLEDPATGYDFHAQECVGNPSASHGVNTVRVARLLAALSFALKRVVDPNDPGATLWDSTVIVVTSEFGRSGSPYSASDTTGGGSEHDGWSGWPVLGGPVVKAKNGGRIVKDGKNDGFFHQNSFFTSVIQAMGVDATNSRYLDYGDFPPIAGLFAAA